MTEKSGYVSGVVVWVLDILIGQLEVTGPIKMSSNHASVMNRFRHQKVPDSQTSAPPIFFQFHPIVMPTSPGTTYRPVIKSTLFYFQAFFKNILQEWSASVITEMQFPRYYHGCGTIRNNILGARSINFRMSFCILNIPKHQ